MNPVEEMFDQVDEDDGEDSGDEPAEPAKRGDDHWAEVSAPLLELIRQSPKSKQTLMVQFAKKLDGSVNVENAICWLENRGLVESFKNFKGLKTYRIPGTASAEAPPPAAPTPRAAEPPVKLVPIRSTESPKKEKPMPRTQEEWVSTAEAAKILGCSKYALKQMRDSGQVKTKKDPNSARGFVFSRKELIDRKPDFLSEPAPPPKAKKAPPRDRALVPRKAPAPKPAAAPAVAAAPSDLGAHVRWVIEGHRLGRFSVEDAFAQIISLVE